MGIANMDCESIMGPYGLWIRKFSGVILEKQKKRWVHQQLLG